MSLNIENNISPYGGLSNELLVEIIISATNIMREKKSNSLYHEIQQWLIHTGLLSHRMYHIIEPILYSRFLINHTPKFLSRILARPDLAPHVRFFQDAPLSDITLERSGLGFGEAEVEAIQTAATRYMRAKDITMGTGAWSPEDLGGLTFESDVWCQEILQGKWEAMTALLLAVLPNLEEIEFTSWYAENDFPHVMRVLRQKPKLRHVSLVYWDPDDGMKLPTFIPFLEIPTLTKFSARKMTDGSAFGLDEDSRCNEFAGLWCPNIKSVSLDFSNLTPQALQSFLRCVPNLELLYCRIAYGLMGFIEFASHKIMAPMQHLKGSLRELHMLIDDTDSGYIDLSQPMGSFADFKYLKFLDICTDYLFSDIEDSMPSLIDVLPSCIENLSLREFKTKHRSKVEELLLHKEQLFPRLRILNLEWEGVIYPDRSTSLEPTQFPGFEREEALSFQKRAQDLGIEMVVKYLPPEEKYLTFETRNNLDGTLCALISTS